MKALQFWKTVTVDDANLLHQLLSLLNEEAASYCAMAAVLERRHPRMHRRPTRSTVASLVLAANAARPNGPWATLLTRTSRRCSH